MSDPYLGEIRMFAGTFAPVGWALCNGSILSISQNTALFSLLGTTYGGNGTSTFALPNLQGTVPIHWGSAPSGSQYVVGQTAGVENVTLLSTQMPQHTHLHNASTSTANQTSPASAIPAVISVGTGKSAAPEPGYIQGTGNTTMAATAIATAGGSQPHTNMQPYLCLTFIIALQGIYPARS